MITQYVAFYSITIRWDLWYKAAEYLLTAVWYHSSKGSERILYQPSGDISGNGSGVPSSWLPAACLNRQE